MKYFGTLYGVEKKHFNEKAEWINNLRNGNANIQKQQWGDNNVEEPQTAFKKSSKLKETGIDQVSCYWLNSLYKGHFILG